MPRLKSANNAQTTLATAIDALATSFTVTDASLFPDAPFRITIDAEIMEVGAIDTNNNIFSSVQRGVESTTAASHSQGASVENRFTAGTHQELVDDDHDHSGGANGPNIPWDNVANKPASATRWPAWSEVTSKPSTFPPSIHKSTHASGGADALSPGDIGAETPTGAQAKVTTHNNVTNAHSATSAATASRIMMRDAAGRAKVVAPSAADDIARKDTVDAKFDVTTGHKHTGAAGDAPKLNGGSLENYTAGDAAILAIDTDDVLRIVTTSATYTKAYEAKIGRAGTLRIKFKLRSDTNGVTANARIYRNGSAIGTARSTDSRTFVEFTEDVSGWSAGDLVQLYFYSSIVDYNVSVHDFRVCCNNPIDIGISFRVSE